MKSKVLLLGAVITALTFTSFAADELLPPRAQSNQIKTVSSSATAPAVTVAYVAPGSALLPPRAQADQAKVASGVANDSNPALACRSGMGGSPRAVAACSQHTTMPGCQTIATAK